MLRVAGGTVNQIPLHWQNNVENIVNAIEQAKEQKVQILCLPELCITGYGCEDMFLSDWVPEKAWEQIGVIQKHCLGITVSIGLPVRIDNTTYNGACVISDGKILGISLKQNLARDGVHYEPRWFDPWPSGKVSEIKRNNQSIQVGDIIYNVNGIRMGFEICEDGWREQRPGYSLFQRGVDLILNPSASHFAMGKSQLREKVVALDASKKFKCAYVFANLLGNEAGRMIYDGDIIIAQNGKLIGQNLRLSFNRFEILYCDIDFDDPKQSQAPKLLDNKDRNEELTKALALGLYDYLRKSGAKGFVLSLSGGADSGTCATMVAEMVKRASHSLGWEVFCKTLGLDLETINNDWRKATGAILSCAYQASKNSSESTFLAAKELAESIGAQFLNWRIDDEVISYSAKIEHAVHRKLNWEQDDITLQNIQARARSPIIWMLANIKHSILLTTSNRSEADVGYATMDGDTSGSLAPIAGLSKPYIIQWLKWAERELNYKGLNRINALQPTAELRPAERQQTDESDLMPYLIMVEIEKLAIQERKSPREVFEEMKIGHANVGQLKSYIKKFFRLWSINQWKRERFAPSFHLDDLNVDPRTWCRFPILSSGFSDELEKL
ncbi:MAG TPA: NAD(+) synthase [Cyclobacteriaceae bacterium]|nr:NAD(+) synthase [Cyclobacteriaceae bacterium]